MWVRCLAHIINLACRDAINSLTAVKAEEACTSQGLDEDSEEENDMEDPSEKLSMSLIEKVTIQKFKASLTYLFIFTLTQSSCERWL